MLLPDLLKRGKLIRRYKRFLADVELDSGEVVVVHCPNPGTMIGCAEPGSEILLRHSCDPKRKLPYTWVMTVVDNVHISVDTMLANKLLFEALSMRTIPELSHYSEVVPEYTYGDSRFDFVLKGESNVPPCLVEVKSTTLAYGECGMFPDAQTVRGRKHLEGLIAARQNGLRAVQFYCVSRADVTTFSPADHIDKVYGETLRRAVEAGVEVMAWSIDVQPSGDRHAVTLAKPVSVVIG
jgi:sugar fermentation stimulation protein A